MERSFKNDLVESGIPSIRSDDSPNEEKVRGRQGLISNKDNDILLRRSHS